MYFEAIGAQDRNKAHHLFGSNTIASPAETPVSTLLKNALQVHVLFERDNKVAITKFTGSFKERWSYVLSSADYLRLRQFTQHEKHLSDALKAREILEFTCCDHKREYRSLVRRLNRTTHRKLFYL